MDHYAAHKEGGQLLHATAWTEGTVTSGKMPVSEGHVLLRLHFHYVSEMTKPPTQRTDYWLPRVRDDGGEGMCVTVKMQPVIQLSNHHGELRKVKTS